MTSVTRPPSSWWNQFGLAYQPTPTAAAEMPRQDWRRSPANNNVAIATTSPPMAFRWAGRCKSPACPNVTWRRNRGDCAGRQWRGHSHDHDGPWARAGRPRVAIVGVTNPDTSFNVNQIAVASVPSPTTFTYQQAGTVEASSRATATLKISGTSPHSSNRCPAPPPSPISRSGQTTLRREWWNGHHRRADFLQERINLSSSS